MNSVSARFEHIMEVSKSKDLDMIDYNILDNSRMVFTYYDPNTDMHLFAYSADENVAIFSITEEQSKLGVMAILDMLVLNSYKTSLVDK